MAIEQDPALIHYPMSMARFGMNDFNEPKYRIVLARTARKMSYPHGAKPKSLPLYPQLPGHTFVLEKWMSAWDFCKMSSEMWLNAGMTLQGPYPSRGVYELSHAFTEVLPGDCNIDKLISWIEAGKKYSANENANAIRDDLTAEQAAQRKINHDRQMERFPAFGLKPFVGGNVSRGTKTKELKYTANALGLPTQKGKTIIKKSRRQYDVNSILAMA